MKKPDEVFNPPHYTWLEGFDTIDLTEQLCFNLGNVVKYTVRASGPAMKHEGDGGITCLRKALWYLQREIDRRERKRTDGSRTADG